jgi:hypothetical protein
MKHFVCAVAMLVVLGLSASSCASVGDALKSKAEGTVQTYPVTYDQAWRVAIAVLRWEDAETIEEHKEDQYMVTTVGANWISEGSAIAVWVEPVDKSNTKVTIVSKRKMQTNIATGLTESTFHEQFAKGVKIVKAGKPLPPEAPKE